jgi:hypothetical protein
MPRQRPYCQVTFQVNFRIAQSPCHVSIRTPSHPTTSVSIHQPVICTTTCQLVIGPRHVQTATCQFRTGPTLPENAKTE